MSQWGVSIGFSDTILAVRMCCVPFFAYNMQILDLGTYYFWSLHPSTAIWHPRLAPQTISVLEKVRVFVRSQSHCLLGCDCGHDIQTSMEHGGYASEYHAQCLGRQAQLRERV